MDWQEQFKSKFVTADEAATKVKSGDLVILPPRPSLSFGLALCARKDELHGVRILDSFPSADFPWFDRGWEENFSVRLALPTSVTQEMFDEHRCDVHVGLMNISQQHEYQSVAESDEPDVVAVQISPPDRHGFCSFGASLWDKKILARKAKVAIGDVNPNFIRTYGDNYVHVSEFDYFIEHASSGGEPGTIGSLAGRGFKPLEPYFETIARYVGELINDGDVLQMGVSRTLESLVKLGMLDEKNDLGWHSEATIPGVIGLVREGVINGSKKTIDRGICVATAIGGDTRDAMEWVHENPLFWVMSCNYVWDVRVIGALDDFVSINGAGAIDLYGQIVVERIGHHQLAFAGGQIPFVIGAWLSRGGKVIHVIPSTYVANNGLRSRIVAEFPPGTWITGQRQSPQYVVTEYGIARLKGKSQRQRAEELIAVAHPDFRAELRERAKWLSVI